MSEEEPHPIPCDDSDGNRYTVYQSPAYVLGSAPSDQLHQPTWFLICEERKVRVFTQKDSKTGKSYFICPELDGLKLYPIDSFIRDEMT